MRNMRDILRDATDATLAGECIQPQAADILALCDEVGRLRAVVGRAYREGYYSGHYDGTGYTLGEEISAEAAWRGSDAKAAIDGGKP